MTRRRSRVANGPTMSARTRGHERGVVLGLRRSSAVPRRQVTSFSHEPKAKVVRTKLDILKRYAPWHKMVSKSSSPSNRGSPPAYVNAQPIQDLIQQSAARIVHDAGNILPLYPIDKLSSAYLNSPNFFRQEPVIVNAAVGRFLRIVAWGGRLSVRLGAFDELAVRIEALAAGSNVVDVLFYLGERQKLFTAHVGSRSTRSPGLPRIQKPAERVLDGIPETNQEFLAGGVHS